MFYKKQLLNLDIIDRMKKLKYEEVYAFFYKNTSRNKMNLIYVFRFGVGDSRGINNLDYRKVLNKYKELNANGLVIVHNHPVPFLCFDKIVKPSYLDLDFTWKIGEICERENINFIDHMIVSKVGYFSFVEHNLIKYNLAI